jgi:hypothetical protein
MWSVAKKAKLYNTRELTNHLRTFAADIEDTFINDEGEAVLVTKAEMLAKRVWQAALGWVEEIVEETDVPGKTKTKKVYHKPAAWAQQFIWERFEGKAPAALPDDQQGLSAADKVDELAKARVNQLTEDMTDGDSERDRVSDSDKPD